MTLKLGITVYLYFGDRGNYAYNTTLKIVRNSDAIVSEDRRKRGSHRI